MSFSTIAKGVFGFGVATALLSSALPSSAASSTIDKLRNTQRCNGSCHSQILFDAVASTNIDRMRNTQRGDERSSWVSEEVLAQSTNIDKLRNTQRDRQASADETNTTPPSPGMMVSDLPSGSPTNGNPDLPSA